MYITKTESVSVAFSLREEVTVSVAAVGRPKMDRSPRVRAKNKSYVDDVVNENACSAKRTRHDPRLANVLLAR